MSFSPALVGAACNLSEADLRVRVAEWATLRNGAARVSLIENGVAVELGPDQDVGAAADLAAREAACCPFYAITITVEGTAHRVAITAGPGGQPAVQALLGFVQ